MNPTLEKLKQNPHYKLSQKQKEELNDKEINPMIEFGVPPVHQHLERRGRPRKYE